VLTFLDARSVDGGQVGDEAEAVADANGDDADDGLGGEVEEGQVPGGAGDDVFVDDGHADGGEAVGADGDGRAVGDLGQRGGLLGDAYGVGGAAHEAVVLLGVVLEVEVGARRLVVADVVIALPVHGGGRGGRHVA
jgi:hypothetical protein